MFTKEVILKYLLDTARTPETNLNFHLPTSYTFLLENGAMKNLDMKIFDYAEAK